MGNVVHLPNLCTEIIEVSTDAETAGAAILARSTSPSTTPTEVWNWAKLRETVCTAVPFLDRVIDINCYPIAQAAVSNPPWRPVGLGVMGLQDVFFSVRLPFYSDAARELSTWIAQEIYLTALDSSAELGPALDVSSLSEAIDAELGAIERLDSVVDPAAGARSHDARSKPWLWFYGTSSAPTTLGSQDCQRLLHHTYLYRRRRRPGLPRRRDLTHRARPPAQLRQPDRRHPRPRHPCCRQGPGNGRPATGCVRIAPRPVRRCPPADRTAPCRTHRSARATGRRAGLPDDTLEKPAGEPENPTLGRGRRCLGSGTRARQVKSTQPVTVVIGNLSYERHQPGRPLGVSPARRTLPVRGCDRAGPPEGRGPQGAGDGTDPSRTRHNRVLCG